MICLRVQAIDLIVMLLYRNRFGGVLNRIFVELMINCCSIISLQF